MSEQGQNMKELGIRQDEVPEEGQVKDERSQGDPVAGQTPDVSDKSTMKDPGRRRLLLAGAGGLLTLLGVGVAARRAQSADNVQVRQINPGEKRAYVPIGYGGRNSEWDGNIKNPEVTVPLSEVAKWYLERAKEVPGTRLTKIVDGKECILKSVTDSDTKYFFNWRASYAQSVSNVTNFMAEDQMGKGYENEAGYDELAIATFSSENQMSSLGINFTELGIGSGKDFKSWGYFGYTTFEENGKKIRMACWSPPSIHPAASDYMMRASSNTALHLVHVSVVGLTNPEDVSVLQKDRMKLIQQDYVYAVQLNNR